MSWNLDGFMFVLVIGSAIVVGLDAQNLKAGKHNLGGIADTSPAVWFLGTLLLWILVFPMYIFTRSKLVAANAGVDSETPAEQRRCAVCDQLYSAEYDGCPHCARTQSAPTGTESP